MSKSIEPGCLAYIKHTSTNEAARGRIVIALRPWVDGDVFCIGEDRFSEPREPDIWWIKAVRDGETLPTCCAYRGGHIRESEGSLAVERAIHLQRIGGPGLVSDADILRERARDLIVDPSNHIFPDIRELDRAAGHVIVGTINYKTGFITPVTPNPFSRGPL